MIWCNMNVSPIEFVSTAFDNFQIECPRKYGIQRLGIRMVESQGLKRTDAVFSISCGSIEQLSPWDSIPDKIAEYEDEECHYTELFDPILTTNQVANCNTREYLSGITRVSGTKIQLQCCKLRTRDVKRCEQKEFTKPLGEMNSVIIESDGLVFNGLKVKGNSYTVKFCSFMPRAVGFILDEVATTTTRGPKTTTPDSPSVTETNNHENTFPTLVSSDDNITFDDEITSTPIVITTRKPMRIIKVPYLPKIKAKDVDIPKNKPEIEDITLPIPSNLGDEVKSDNNDSMDVVNHEFFMPTPGKFDNLEILSEIQFPEEKLPNGATSKPLVVSDTINNIANPTTTNISEYPATADTFETVDPNTLKKSFTETSVTNSSEKENAQTTDSDNAEASSFDNIETTRTINVPDQIASSNTEVKETVTDNIRPTVTENNKLSQTTTVTNNNGDQTITDNVQTDPSVTDNTQVNTSVTDPIQENLTVADNTQKSAAITDITQKSATITDITQKSTTLADNADVSVTDASNGEFESTHKVNSSEKLFTEKANMASSEKLFTDTTVIKSSEQGFTTNGKSSEKMFTTDTTFLNTTPELKMPKSVQSTFSSESSKSTVDPASVLMHTRLTSGDIQIPKISLPDPSHFALDELKETSPVTINLEDASTTIQQFSEAVSIANTIKQLETAEHQLIDNKVVPITHKNADTFETRQQSQGTLIPLSFDRGHSSRIIHQQPLNTLSNKLHYESSESLPKPNPLPVYSQEMQDEVPLAIESHEKIAVAQVKIAKLRHSLIDKKYTPKIIAHGTKNVKEESSEEVEEQSNKEINEELESTTSQSTTLETTTAYVPRRLRKYKTASDLKNSYLQKMSATESSTAHTTITHATESTNKTPYQEPNHLLHPIPPQVFSGIDEFSSFPFDDSENTNQKDIHDKYSSYTVDDDSATTFAPNSVKNLIRQQYSSKVNNNDDNSNNNNTPTPYIKRRKTTTESPRAGEAEEKEVELSEEKEVELGEEKKVESAQEKVIEQEKPPTNQKTYFDEETQLSPFEDPNTEDIFKPLDDNSKVAANVDSKSVEEEKSDSSHLYPIHFPVAHDIRRSPQKTDYPYHPKMFETDKNQKFVPQSKYFEKADNKEKSTIPSVAKQLYEINAVGKNGQNKDSVIQIDSFLVTSNDLTNELEQLEREALKTTKASVLSTTTTSILSTTTASMVLPNGSVIKASSNHRNENKSVYDEKDYYRKPKLVVRRKEKYLTFCTREEAIRDVNDMVIACGGDYDVWIPPRCPAGTSCFHTTDSSFRICCPVNAS
uniref:ZP domain-containing protein n=1 Tax=Rhabditophanes sp. KR3021 TaxID=114890 RepID=A0AC35U622_9BILA